MTASSRARLAALECALVAGLRADDPDEVRQIAAVFQDDMLDQAIVGARGTTAFRAGFSQQRREIAARLGASILPAAPDRIM